MVKICETCKKGIPTNEKAYSCVACSSQTHMTPECTALSSSILNGLKEIRLNAMLLCNACVENN